MQRPGLAPGMAARLPGNHWRRAKEVFLNATGARKPKSKDFYAKVSHPTEGMDKALSVVDAAYALAPADAHAGAALQTAKNGYMTARDGYLRLLKAEYNTPPGEVNAIAYKNAVVTLERELKAIEIAITGEITSRHAALT